MADVTVGTKKPEFIRQKAQQQAEKQLQADPIKETVEVQGIKFNRPLTDVSPETATILEKVKQNPDKYDIIKHEGKIISIRSKPQTYIFRKKKGRDDWKKTYIPETWEFDERGLIKSYKKFDAQKEERSYGYKKYIVQEVQKDFSSGVLTSGFEKEARTIKLQKPKETSTFKIIGGKLRVIESSGKIRNARKDELKSGISYIKDVNKIKSETSKDQTTLSQLNKKLKEGTPLTNKEFIDLTNIKAKYGENVKEISDIAKVQIKALEQIKGEKEIFTGYEPEIKKNVMFKTSDKFIKTFKNEQGKITGFEDIIGQKSYAITKEGESFDPKALWKLKATREIQAKEKDPFTKEFIKPTTEQKKEIEPFSMYKHGGVFGKVGEAFETVVKKTGEISTAILRPIPTFFAGQLHKQSLTIQDPNIKQAGLFGKQFKTQVESKQFKSVATGGVSLASYTVPYIGTTRMITDVGSWGTTALKKKGREMIVNYPIESAIATGFVILEGISLSKQAVRLIKTKGANQKIKNLYSELDDINTGKTKLKVKFGQGLKKETTKFKVGKTKVKTIDVKSADVRVGTGETKNLKVLDVYNTKKQTLTRYVWSKQDPNVRTVIDIGSPKVYAYKQSGILKAKPKIITIEQRYPIKVQTYYKGKVVDTRTTTTFIDPTRTKNIDIEKTKTFTLDKNVRLEAGNIKSKVTIRKTPKTIVKSETKLKSLVVSRLKKKQRLLDYGVELRTNKYGGYKQVLKSKKTTPTKIVLGDTFSEFKDIGRKAVFQAGTSEGIKIKTGFEGFQVRAPRVKTTIITKETNVFSVENIGRKIKPQRIYANIPFSDIKTKIKVVTPTPKVDTKINVFEGETAELFSAIGETAFLTETTSIPIFKSYITETEALKQIEREGTINKKIDALTKQKIDTKTKIEQLTKQKIDIKTKIEQLTKQKVSQLTEQKILQLTKQKIDTKQKIKVLTKQIVETKTKVKVLTKQKIATKQKVKAMQSITKTQPITQPQINIQLQTPIQPIIPIIPIIPSIPPTTKQSQPKGFAVLVRKKGVFERVNIKPLLESEAIQKGKFEVGTTSSATFKIVEAKGEIGRFLKKGIDKDFYKKDNLFIEKRGRRIKSAGELREITLKGIQATRGKRNKPQKSKKNIWGL